MSEIRRPVYLTDEEYELVVSVLQAERDRLRSLAKTYEESAGEEFSDRKRARADKVQALLDQIA